MQAKPTNLLLRLKTETAPAHADVEQALDLEARTSSLSAYRHLIARFYGFHVTWEPCVEAALADPQFFHPRRKSKFLERDLRELGMTQGAILRLPLWRPTMSIRTAAEALGSMYVLEGSTLGGVIIARHVERSLGLGRSNGCSYFRCYGDEVGRMWLAFKAALLTRCPPDEEDRAIEAAQRTFETLRSWLVIRKHPKVTPA